MTDKKSFGKYIAEKRKEVHLTQEELASKLYVIPTTVSKWERGVSYPDITVISKLCKILNISEHEFFMACDDEVLNEEKREISNFRNFKKWLIKSLNISYVLSLNVCFICNLVLDHKLSWFLIVLGGLLIAFVLTTFPTYLKKNKYRLIKVMSIFTVLMYLLLGIINYVNGGAWLLDSFKIATFVLIVLWADILVINFVNINKYFKISLSLFLLAFLTIFTNPFCAKVLNIVNEGGDLPNILSAIVLFMGTLYFLSKGFRR